MARKQNVGARFETEEGAKAPAPLKTAVQIASAASAEKPEIFPTDLKQCFALLAELNAEQVSTQEDWEAKQPRLKALKTHIYHLQQGLPVVETKSGDYSHAHLSAVTDQMKVAALIRTNPAVAAVVAERDALKARNAECRKQNAETLAGTLYAVYGAAVGGTAFNGDPLPTWEAFRADENKKLQSDAWVGVAAEAIKALTV